MPRVEPGVSQYTQEFVPKSTDILNSLLLSVSLLPNLFNLVDVVLADALVLLLDPLHLGDVPFDEVPRHELKYLSRFPAHSQREITQYKNSREMTNKPCYYGQRYREIVFLSAQGRQRQLKNPG